MAKPITKVNWPLWLFGLAFIAFLLFMVLLEVTPGPLAWALGFQLFIAVGGAAISSLALIIRAVIATSRWAKAAEAGRQRTQRIIGVILGYLFAIPFVYFWFAMIALVGGFLSIAVDQRHMYH